MTLQEAKNAATEIVRSDEDDEHTAKLLKSIEDLDKEGLALILEEGNEENKWIVLNFPH